MDAIAETRNEAPMREIVIWPHRSLQRRGFFVVPAVFLAGIAFVGAMIWLAPGAILGGGLVALMVLPFFLVTLAGLIFALRRNDRDRARQCERLGMYKDRLRLERVDAQGRRSFWEAPLGRVALRTREEAVRGLVLTLRADDGAETALGDFLAPAERPALAEELREFLAEARRRAAWRG